ncbi:MAG: molybdenum cofactor biosynthesis protein MoaE, partial [Pseudomonadota bacterium]|nr:molybdenum cofactor biosynthesis protein MoaE [Pseudomonadota bacterium]
MNPGPTIRVQAQDFDLQAEIDALAKGRRDIGAVVTFTGLCRDEQGSLTALELEHYPGMAEAEMRRIAQIALDRFSLVGLSAIHRFG